MNSHTKAFLEVKLEEFCILWKIQYEYPSMNFDSTCIIAHNEKDNP